MSYLYNIAPTGIRSSDTDASVTGTPLGILLDKILRNIIISKYAGDCLGEDISVTSPLFVLGSVKSSH